MTIIGRDPGTRADGATGLRFNDGAVPSTGVRLWTVPA